MTLSKEDIERIPDGAGSVTKLRRNERPRKQGFFVSYRRKSDMNVIDRIWRFFPINDDPINNKTEIVSQIYFDRSSEAEPRIEERNLQALRESRLRVEQEIATIAAGGRTFRVTGSIRKAFELAKKKGRADIDYFLQKNCRKPGVERKLKAINYADEEDAILRLENVLRIFDEKPSDEMIRQDQLEKN